VLRGCDGKRVELCDCGKGDTKIAVERNGAPVRVVCRRGGETAVCPAGGQQWL
jgi:hypothetical protein